MRENLTQGARRKKEPAGREAEKGAGRSPTLSRLNPPLLVRPVREELHGHYLAVGRMPFEPQAPGRPEISFEVTILVAFSFWVADLGSKETDRLPQDQAIKDFANIEVGKKEPLP